MRYCPLTPKVRLVWNQWYPGNLPDKWKVLYRVKANRKKRKHFLCFMIKTKYRFLRVNLFNVQHLEAHELILDNLHQSLAETAAGKCRWFLAISLPQVSITFTVTICYAFGYYPRIGDLPPLLIQTDFLAWIQYLWPISSWRPWGRHIIFQWSSYRKWQRLYSPRQLVSWSLLRVFILCCPILWTVIFYVAIPWY